MDKYVALLRFQVHDHPAGPRWLSEGDPVPTGYMSKGMVDHFVAMGWMELEEVAAKAPAEEAEVEATENSGYTATVGIEELGGMV